MLAMVDAVTGDVYSLPLAMKDRSMHDTLALPWLRIGNSVGGVVNAGGEAVNVGPDVLVACRPSALRSRT
jgi:hypothetical protein